jgi:hypothetical protein
MRRTGHHVLVQSFAVASGDAGANIGLLYRSSLDRWVTTHVKWVTYSLILLAGWAQFDDVLLLPVSVAECTPCSSDDDEYVPATGRKAHPRSAAQPRPMPVDRNGPGATLPGFRTRLPFDGGQRTPLNVPLLYVYMSLQI